MASRALLAAATVLALAAGCGEDEAPVAPPAQTVELRVSVFDGDRTRRRATLTCGGNEAGATGFFAERPAGHCRSARRVAPALLGTPPARRTCTEIYGGPQTARITGTIDGRPVNRRLSRRNGCEIADWTQVEPLLAPSGIEPGVEAP